MIEAKTAELAVAAGEELDEVLALGGAFEAVDELERWLVRVEAERVRRIESGDLLVVGVNSFTETEPSPLETDDDGAARILKVDPAAEAQLARRRGDVASPARRRRGAGREPRTHRPSGGRRGRKPHAGHDRPAHAGGTTGEWAGALREVFGEYRAPTG